MKKSSFKLRIQYNSPVILTFTFVSLAILGIDSLASGYLTQTFFSIYRSSLLDILSYVRLFTHILGHSDFSHYLNNFLIILLIGPVMEEKYGSQNILLLITLTAFATGLVHIIFSPNTALLGASSIAFMLILLGSATNFGSGGIPLTLILVASLYIGQEILNGVISNDSVSQLSHITGGICGCVGGFILRPNQ